MTRDEAIRLFHQATYDSGKPGGISSPGQFEKDRVWSERAIDGFVKLGMLKLDEPVSLDARINQAIWAYSQLGSIAPAALKEALSRAGLKIVEQ